MDAKVLSLESIEMRRRVAGLTRKQVYDEAGVHHSTWDRLMAGKHSPNLATLEKLSSAIDRLTTPAARAAE